MKISILFELDIGEDDRRRAQLDALLAGVGAITSAASAPIPTLPPTPAPTVAPAPVTPRKYPARLAFDEFDVLARAELQRLACDGHMCGFAVWDVNRDARLPTMSGVMQRYKVKRTAELASLVGLLPPPERRAHAR